MKYLLIFPLVLSFSQEVYAQNICNKFVLDLAKRINDQLYCEKNFEIEKEVYRIVPLNCEYKTDRLHQMCVYMLRELEIDSKKWVCKKSFLTETDKKWICFYE